MAESEIQEILDLEMSHSRGEVVEVKNGGLERDSTEERGDCRLRVAIDLDHRSQEISGIHGMSANSPQETTGGISAKGHRQRPLTLFLLAEEVRTEHEEGVIGISIDGEGVRILKSGTRLHLEAGPATGIGRGNCAMTEIVIENSRTTGERTTFEESGKIAKEMIVFEGSNLFVQTPEIRQADNKRPSHLVRLL